MRLRQSNKTALRAFIRHSDPAFTQHQPQAQLAAIWQKASELAERRIGAALWLAFDATYSARRKDESETDFQQREQNGLPATLFGRTSPGEGRDKLRHFFASALLAYYFTGWLADLGGIIIEVLGFLSLPLGGTGYNKGDIHADRCGRAFGLALKQDPAVDVKNFIKELGQ